MHLSIIRNGGKVISTATAQIRRRVAEQDSSKQGRVFKHIVARNIFRIIQNPENNPAYANLREVINKSRIPLGPLYQQYMRGVDTDQGLIAYTSSRVGKEALSALVIGCIVSLTRLVATIASQAQAWKQAHDDRHNVLIELALIPTIPSTITCKDNGDVLLLPYSCYKLMRISQEDDLTLLFVEAVPFPMHSV